MLRSNANAVPLWTACIMANVLFVACGGTETNNPGPDQQVQPGSNVPTCSSDQRLVDGNCMTQMQPTEQEQCEADQTKVWNGSACVEKPVELTAEICMTRHAWVISYFNEDGTVAGPKGWLSEFGTEPIRLQPSANGQYCTIIGGPFRGVPIVEDGMAIPQSAYALKKSAETFELNDVGGLGIINFNAVSI